MKLSAFFVCHQFHGGEEGIRSLHAILNSLSVVSDNATATPAAIESCACSLLIPDKSGPLFSNPAIQLINKQTT